MDYAPYIAKLKERPNQLELFPDARAERARRMIIALLENRDKIHRMHRVMVEVLGEDDKNEKGPWSS